MEELLPGLWRIPVPLPNNPLRELNSYLIRGRGVNLLIDTGFRMPECRTALVSALEALEVRLEETDILLTHLHSDHSGLAPDLIAPGRSIFVGRLDLPYLAHSEKWKKDDGSRFLKMGFPKSEVERLHTDNPAQSLAPAHCEQYVALDEGDTLTYGDYSLKAILTPGHTPGQMCFGVEKQKLLFTGDHILFDITPNITDWPELPDALGSYMRSLEKIKTYADYRALPGHRGGGDLAQRVTDLQVHHLWRMGEAWQAAKAAPGSTAYQLAGQISWKIKARSWAEFPLAQKWFAVGECQAHLDRLRTLGRIARSWDGTVWRYEAVDKEEL